MKKPRRTPVVRHQDIIAIIRRQAKLPTPYHELWFGVIAQAVRDLELDKKLYAEDALCFFAGAGFLVVCDLLGLEPGYVLSVVGHLGAKINGMPKGKAKGDGRGKQSSSVEN